jgi:beta-lactamase regulating signal transducer with metallopeptidase domain
MTSVAKAVVESLAMIALQGTVLAAIALVLARGRLRPAWQAAIWLVVLVKFVLPWGPAMPWSLADLVAALRHQPAEAGAFLVGAGAAPVARIAPSPLWLVLAIAWANGTAIVLGRAIVAHARVLHAARRAQPAPAWARALVASFARRAPALVVGHPAIGPHVVGVFRPIIVIPPALLEDRAVLLPALLHELAHVRRWDALARIVQLVAGAVFFWWPVVRLASRRLDAAREAACDAWALEASEVARPTYARLLVRMAQLRAPAAASLAAQRGLDARVAAVLGPPARAGLSGAHKLALLGWILVALGGARAASAHPAVACRYTVQLAEALRAAHPEADLDGDGVLSRDEACEFQQVLRQRVEAPASDQVSRLDELDESLLSEPLCCNCDHGAEDSAPWIEKRTDACPSEGASR